MIAEWASIYIIYDASITLFEKAWTWHEVPVPNHLMETESEFAPWDLSKAHILVSTPEHVGKDFLTTYWGDIIWSHYNWPNRAIAQNDWTLPILNMTELESLWHPIDIWAMVMATVILHRNVLERRLDHQFSAAILVVFSPWVIILPTQTMHFLKGEILPIYHTFVVFRSPPNG